MTATVFWLSWICIGSLIAGLVCMRMYFKYADLIEVFDSKYDTTTAQFRLDSTKSMVWLFAAYVCILIFVVSLVGTMVKFGA